MIQKDDLLRMLSREVHIGLPVDTKRTLLYKSERAVYRKVKERYPNKYLLSDVEEALFTISDVHKLIELEKETARDIVIKLIGSKKLDKYCSNK